MYNHTAIPVINRQESQKFYEVLGLSKLREWQKPERKLEATVMKNKDGYILELIHHPTNSYAISLPIVEIRHIGFSVNDLQLVINKLIGMGGKVVKPISPGFSVKEFAFIEDPSGNLVELVVES